MSLGLKKESQMREGKRAVLETWRRLPPMPGWTPFL